MDVSRARIWRKHLERYTYAVPPLFAEENPDTRRKLIKPLWWISTVCKEWYIALRDYIVNSLGVDDHGNSVTSWGAKDAQYNPGERLRDMRFGLSKMVFLRYAKISGE